MKQVLRAVLAVVVVVAGAPPAAAQQAQSPADQPPATQPPAAQTPPTQTPAPPAPAATAPAAIPGTVACPVPVPPAVAPARAFSAPAGMLFYQVIPARIPDFDTFIAYVRDALAKTTNAKLREQYKGLAIWRTVEAGPNGDALFVFLVNPAVPCLDYALSPILSEAYPDPAQLGEIWKLYTTSVRPMGTTLLNLVPVPVVTPPPPLTPPTTPVQPSPTAKPTPPSPK